ncbi:PhzF family phenazine biosynthesis protein [Microbacterium sp. 4R-513]|uniref:PhzF family phenazine biosynthesis protein n=1 Tax=Microbacterium sp. 4R-513 TaxID=2567934 RepID=UPI0013E1871B|nr:PhzF family phenazine biosynthesis protein [Microbacterium sp. 4R-513]QIG39335.1 PhzF family phenazine biosynthesis protein [Microbacterium sp. 4R-513]
MVEVLRYAAFVDPRHPGGGNPAGVVPDASSLTDADMQAIAADVGYSETAFLTGNTGKGATDDGETGATARGIRYFSPIAEVPFCGHATIATAVLLAEREGAGRFVFATPVGDVTIDTAPDDGGTIWATFTSIEPEVRPFDEPVLTRLSELLGLTPKDISPGFPPRISFAGNRHPVLVVESGEVFDGVSFDPARMRELMDAEGWAGTVTLAHRLGDTEWEARNPFPVGAITEDPATGSAAAAFGAYLRALGDVPDGGRLTIHQGRHVGRPSLLLVDIPDEGGIGVSGTAAPIT